jgi:outer membrane protein assembly factor BamB
MLPAQNNADWRYDRTGNYSNETGLLKSWPAAGPKLLWHFDGIGEGHSSVTIASGKIYVTGLLDEKGYLFVFDRNGKLLNKLMYGDEWAKSYPGARANPVINDGKIYLMSGIGDLICLDEKTLSVVWKKNIFEDFHSKNLRWGFYEAPLIVGEKLIVTPGGKEYNIVALDKNSGSLIWSCKGKGDVAAYCTPLYVSAQNIIPQAVVMTAEHVLGVDIETGKMLWSFYYKEKNSVHPNTPVFVDNTLMIQAPDIGATMLRFKNGGREVEKIWEEAKLDPITGHSVIVGDYIYTSGYVRGGNNFWYCANRRTGKIMYRDNTITAGAVIYADGMLYCYTEKGQMALVKPDTQKFDLVSQFPVTMGTEQHWAHPVIHQGVLYVRHGDTLMAYGVN